MNLFKNVKISSKNHQIFYRYDLFSWSNLFLNKNIYAHFYLHLKRPYRKTVWTRNFLIVLTASKTKNRCAWTVLLFSITMRFIFLVHWFFRFYNTLSFWLHYISIHSRSLSVDVSHVKEYFFSMKPSHKLESEPYTISYIYIAALLLYDIL